MEDLNNHTPPATRGSIKRYGIDIHGETYEDADGSWVLHSDHATALAEMREDLKFLARHIELLKHAVTSHPSTTRINETDVLFIMTRHDSLLEQTLHRAKGNTP